jgi:hypothetical protein
MSLFSGIDFSTPWILAALILLPLVWFLLRVTPPLPKQVYFPPLKLLAGLRNEEQTPAGTPWWLMLIRLMAAGALIVALAGPQLGRTLTLAGRGPLILVIDNGWTAATNWDEHKGLAAEALRLAERERRPAAVISTADRPDASILDAGEAARALEGLKPRPWLAGRGPAIGALAALKIKGAEILWLSDGIDDGKAEALTQALHRLGRVRIFRDRAERAPQGIVSVSNTADGLEALVLRAVAGGKRAGTLIATGANGETLGSAAFTFASGDNRAVARIALPLEMRNKAYRLAIAGEKSAGAVYLFDRGAPRRAVGLAESGGGEEPLLSGQYYLERALAPYADVVKGDIPALIDRKVPVLILAGTGNPAGADRDRVVKFIEDGGLLIRFAGAALAAGGDDLVPVPLRSGGRYLGGALTWAAPQALAPFPAASPFGGLAIPGDVTVSQQILAEPSVELSQHSWARLADGTPMVTASQRGKGWIVLFHVTASPAWSNLPLSGLFVDMLRRLLPLSTGTGPADLAQTAILAPVFTLDGFGRLHRAGSEVEPVKAGALDGIAVSPLHPPGLYGAAGAMRALNTARADTALAPMEKPLTGGSAYADRTSIDLAPPLLALAGLLMLADLALSLILRGFVPDVRKLWRGLLPVFFAFFVLGPRADANDAFALKAALDTRLAYVVTGAADTDAMSKAGLGGLGRMMAARTSYEAQEPMGVDLETDDLNFFPLIYWPMEPRQKNLSAHALAKLADYMREGGTLLIDTRDLTLGASAGAGSPGQRTLRRLLGGLDLPPLQTVPANHVLTRTFYLIDDFPGRWQGGKLWVQAPSRGDALGVGDGVSPVIVGGNDWAAAWAVDADGRPLADVSPGGERQREMAFRFGINVAMYALTGNYKTDQIHVPTILKRLGR